MMRFFFVLLLTIAFISKYDAYSSEDDDDEYERRIDLNDDKSEIDALRRYMFIRKLSHKIKKPRFKIKNEIDRDLNYKRFNNEDEDNLEILRRFFHKKTTTAAPTTILPGLNGLLNGLTTKKQVISTPSSGGSGLNGLINGLTSAKASPSVSVQSGGGLNGLINGLTSTKAATYSVSVSSGGSGGLNGLINGLTSSKASPSVSAPSGGGLNGLINGLTSSKVSPSAPSAPSGGFNGIINQYTPKSTTKSISPVTSAKTGAVCLQNPCLNGGTCHQFSFGTYCQCPASHYGKHCETAFSNAPNYKPNYNKFAGRSEDLYERNANPSDNGQYDWYNNNLNDFYYQYFREAAQNNNPYNRFDTRFYEDLNRRKAIPEDSVNNEWNNINDFYYAYFRNAVPQD